jgi:hypothetical protein
MERPVMSVPDSNAALARTTTAVASDRDVIFQVRVIFIVLWMAFWLCGSLGMVLLSFSGLQFQSNVSSRLASAANVGTTHVTNERLRMSVHRVRLHRKDYDEKLLKVQGLKKAIDEMPVDTSIRTGATLEEIYASLLPVLFKEDRVPAESDTIAEIRSRCERAEGEVKVQCNRKLRKADLLTQLIEVQGLMKLYEDSEEYSDGEDLRSFEVFAFWFLLPALPAPLLVLLVTLSMGALGSILFMLQIHLSTDAASDKFRTSVGWHVCRPFQGMAAALAIFLVVKAGQLSIGSSSAVNAGADLNVFVLALLGVISGLLSDVAIERLSAAGIEVLKATSPKRTKSRDKQDSPATGAASSKGSDTATSPEQAEYSKARDRRDETESPAKGGAPSKRSSASSAPMEPAESHRDQERGIEGRSSREDRLFPVRKSAQSDFESGSSGPKSRDERLSSTERQSNLTDALGNTDVREDAQASVDKPVGGQPQRKR